jgi:hypothetical protein
VNARLADRDPVRVLSAGLTIARFASQVAQRAIRVTNPEITTMRRAVDVAAMIAENRGDRREIAGIRHLSDKQDGMGENGAGGIDPGRTHESSRQTPDQESSDAVHDRDSFPQWKMPRRFEQARCYRVTPSSELRGDNQAALTRAALTANLA